MPNEIKLHPLSIRGRFYVDVSSCITNCGCKDIAPNNFKVGEGFEEDYGAYIFKQPENKQELKQCKETIF